MKKLLLSIIAITFIFALPVKSDQSEFCEGFERGYIVGFKKAAGAGYEPYVPYCPYPPYKRYNDPESDYEHGYIIGFKKGSRS